MTMFEMKYPHLFTPISLGKTIARNRIFTAPTGWNANDANDQATSEAVAYYELKAKGGAAVVTVGETSIDSVNGKCAPFEMALDNPRAIMNFSVMADAIKKHGALASCELVHPGWIATSSILEGNEVFSSVEVEIHGGTVGMIGGDKKAKAMTEEQILDIIEKFADGALTLKKAGFDMVLIHGGHGWLISQFMSPKFNTRTDKWGGSLENCMRFPIEICKRIKEKCGKDFPIEFRMSADECIPTGYGLEDGIKMAVMLEDYIDILHASVGFHENPVAFHIMCPDMFKSDECNLEYAAAIKKHVSIPVATVGAFNCPDKMEAALASGKADIIEAARAFLADPEMPNKARVGKPEEIKQCIRCYTCFSKVLNKLQFSCAINPQIGNENESKYALPPVSPQKVLIAGGGIGGMEAALEAAKLGHEVILCEKTERLGGVLHCESEVAFKHKLDLYINSQAKKVQNLSGIEVRLNTPVTKELAETIQPDAIICAMGARPVVPTFIKGYDNKNVFGAEEIYYDNDKAGKRVIILGGGLVGCELGIHLAMNGREVTILEMMPALNFGDNILHGRAIMNQISEQNMQLSLETKAVEITEKGVIGETKEGTNLFEADTVIYALGQRPLRNEADEIRFCAPEFHQIGDCNVPANIGEATIAAYYAARNIGRN